MNLKGGGFVPGGRLVEETTFGPRTNGPPWKSKVGTDGIFRLKIFVPFKKQGDDPCRSVFWGGSKLQRKKVGPHIIMGT